MDNNTFVVIESSLDGVRVVHGSPTVEVISIPDFSVLIDEWVHGTGDALQEFVDSEGDSLISTLKSKLGSGNRAQEDNLRELIVDVEGKVEYTKSFTATHPLCV